jgi:hypothetical protein
VPLLVPLLRWRSPCWSNTKFYVGWWKFAFVRPSLLGGFLPSKGVGGPFCDARMCFFGCCLSSKGDRHFRRHFCQVAFRLPLAPILLANSPKSLEGSTQGGVVMTGLEDAPRPLWSWQSCCSVVAPIDGRWNVIFYVVFFCSLFVFVALCLQTFL